MGFLLVQHLLTFLVLFPYFLHHLIAVLRHHHLKPTSISKPHHPLPFTTPILRHLPLLLLLLFLLLSLLLHLLHPLPSLLLSLQLSLSLLLFLLLPLPLPLPVPLTFLLASLAFLVSAFVNTNFASFYPSSDLQSKSASVTAAISGVSAVGALVLAVNPGVFVAELVLVGSVGLRGLWAAVAGVVLYAEGFVPEGCHRLLDVNWGATRCEIEEARVRAGMIMDLAFVAGVVVVAVVIVAVYLGVGKGVSGGRRLGAYEAIPMVGIGTEMREAAAEVKAAGKSSMQA